jgi:hypothetical protein
MAKACPPAIFDTKGQEHCACPNGNAPHHGPHDTASCMQVHVAKLPAQCPPGLFEAKMHEHCSCALGMALAHGPRGTAGCMQEIAAAPSVVPAKLEHCPTGKFPLNHKCECPAGQVRVGDGLVHAHCAAQAAPAKR